MHRIIHIPETQSTNTYLKSLAAEGERDLCIIADRQTGGRGRLGRTFESPDGGLYMSFIWTPDGDISGDTVTARAAVAAARAVERLTGITVGIKWVNDLYVNERKLAGILAEGSIDPHTGKLTYLIIGIGVNLTDGGLSREISSIATSVEAEGGTVPDKTDLAREIIREFDDCTDCLEEYRRRQILMGKKVTGIRGNETVRGTAEAIDDDFAMVIRLDDGTLVKMNSGEISLRLEG